MIASATMTTTTLGDWNVGDGYKMHYPQIPDLSKKGLDVSMFWGPLADDFECSEDGYITDIHFWGSFKDDILPTSGADGLKFQVSIRSDIPAGKYFPWSIPGSVLWTKTFSAPEYTVRDVPTTIKEGWYDPQTGDYLPFNHQRVYQYNLHIDWDEAFFQYEGTIYWLEIDDIAMPQPNPLYEFGWKTTRPDLHWTDDAVQFNEPLEYPDGHDDEGKTLDLAFVINGGTPPPPLILTIPPIKLTPLILNLKSQGRWVTAEISPPKDVDVKHIEIHTVMLEGSIRADWGKIRGNKLMVKFDRGDLEDILTPGTYNLKVAAHIDTCEYMEGNTETITVM
jgi:hypothetical protein